MIKLPNGWTLEPSEYGEWYNLVDKAGSKTTTELTEYGAEVFAYTLNEALAAEREKARGLVDALEKMQSLWYARGPHFNAGLTEEEFYEADTKWTDECIANMDATLAAYRASGEV